MFKDGDAFSTNMGKIQAEALQRFLEASGKGDVITDSKDIGEQRMMARKQVIDESDLIALERILGENDLVPIAYLIKGFKTGDSVCKIKIRNKLGNEIGCGTGFLIAPGILMTNNHVLPDVDTALVSGAEFNYQNDENFMPCPEYYFQLEPEKFFMTDYTLDFTIVAVKDEEYQGKRVSDFGYIQLLDNEEKIVEGEYVSIIQHPNGSPKSVTLRENQVKSIVGDYIHYMTDTQPGSSGSPVFNDQWVAVALHHAGVPNPDKKGDWVANEGIRISSIVKYIKAQYPNLDGDKKKIVETMFPNLLSDKEKAVYSKASKGYDPLFLGADYQVALPQLSNSMKEDVSKLKDGSFVLDYVHFSIVMCKSRGLAYFTGVNIDGNAKVHIDREGDRWRFDKRIDEKYQYGNEVYRKNDLDRGHLVKRTEPNWGPDAQQANDDTFHYTNSAPQHKDLNQKIWRELEDYILNNAQNHSLKISVFTGPVFRENDLVYKEKYKIPADFWKVVVMVKDDGNMSATAYLQTQENMLDNLEFVYGGYKTYQVPIAEIEKLTGLDFGALSEYDPIANVESAVRLIGDESSIRL